MKTALKILSAALVVMFFSSCSQQAVYYDASGNSVSSSDSMSAKGKYVAPPVVEAKPKKSWFCCPQDQKPKVAKVRKPRVRKVKSQGCTKCLSTYCPAPDCCGTISNSVLSRVTMQGGSGEPYLGLIPTMKTLAPEL